MNTTAYLAGLGWKGEGHALQPSGRGLMKPLLAAHKQNINGLGMRKENAITSQWWLNSFDKSLKSFDLQDKTTTAESLAVQAEVKRNEDAKQMLLGKYFDSAGLYARFVTGDGLKGTLGVTAYKGDMPVEAVEKAVVLGSTTTRTTNSRKRRRRLETNDRDADLSIREHKDGSPRVKAPSQPSAKVRHRGEDAACTDAKAIYLNTYSLEGLENVWDKRSSPEVLKMESDEWRSRDMAMQKIQTDGNRKRENRTIKASTTSAVHCVVTGSEEDGSHKAKPPKKKTKKKTKKKKARRKELAVERSK